MYELRDKSKEYTKCRVRASQDFVEWVSTMDDICGLVISITYWWISRVVLEIVNVIMRNFVVWRVLGDSSNGR